MCADIEKAKAETIILHRKEYSTQCWPHVSKKGNYNLLLSFSKKRHLEEIFVIYSSIK